MTLYPEIQRRAQEELDRVIGTDRMPTFSDRKNLPYIDALVKEAIRWHPVAPLGKSSMTLFVQFLFAESLCPPSGLPHVPTEDTIVNGYTIPKGTIMLANIWSALHFRE